MDNYQLLVNKLDQFIRKYYVNKLIRGLLYFVGLVLALFLLMAILEYYFYFGKTTRKILFYSFVGVSGWSLYAWILKPIFQYFRLGRTISHEQAAQIIGSHFGNVQDKLLNVLQLKQLLGDQQRELVVASIDQKSESIKLVPFRSAINLALNRKYLKYALPPLLLLLVLLFAAPSLITDSAFRLIRNNVDYEKPAPFSFLVQNEDLKVIQYETFPLTVMVDGEVIPNEVFIEVEDYEYRMVKRNKDVFVYEFNNVQEDTEFRIYAGGVVSKHYTLDVLEKPNLVNIDVDLDFPTYIGRKDERLNNIGDLVIPAGTKVNWNIQTSKTDGIQMAFIGQEIDPSKINVDQTGEDQFSYSKKVLKSQQYKLFISNDLLPNADSVNYTITVQPDLFPSITSQQFKDSLNDQVVYFAGEASDDYGLLSLSFNYTISKDGNQGEVESLKLNKPNGNTIQFNHVFDLKTLNLTPGDQVAYYFEVFDNDQVNGSKSARTNTMLFSVPSKEELEAQANKNEEQIKEDLQSAIEESKKIQEELKKLREKLLQEKEMDWQTRKEFERLLERQKELEQEIQKAKENFEENLKNQKEFEQQQPEDIQEKQEQLQKLFEEATNEEMEELRKKIEELLQEMEKEEALEMLENFQFNDEEMENELDRMLELFKQLEVEKELQESIDELQELAEQQEELSEQTENQDKSQEELQQEQQDISDSFEDLKEKIDELQEKNEALESPKDMDDRGQEMDQIEMDIDQSQQQLQQNQNQDASQSQKNAAQKMKEMANSMSMEMQSAQMQQMQEDMQALRQLLENLVGLSFEQEDLMDEFDQVIINTPRYVDLVQNQFKLQDDFKIVEDSLTALSKRVFQIEAYVTEKVSEIKSNLRSGIDDLEERKKTQASVHQQFTMKNLNDLALMLSETMNQMQQQMAAMMSGQQMCNNPNPGQQGQQGNVPSDKISEGQKQLNEDMRNMQQKQGEGEGISSEEFAKMAARQAALRKALREKQKQLQENGKGLSEQIQELMDQMDESETDLVNKRLNNEMMKRQQDILTRLLESERAEREREFDDQRKSESAQQFERKVPPSLEEYLKERASQIEMYRAVSPNLKPYYKFLVEEYFKQLKEN